MANDMSAGETSPWTKIPGTNGPLNPYFLTAAGFTVVVNLTLLVAPLYMLQVYDRVLTSGSIETLILITLLALGLLLVYAVAEAARRRTMALASSRLQSLYDEQEFAQGLQSLKPGRLLGDQTDLSTMQQFLSHGMILPFMDLPFTPFFILVMFLVHPILGFLALGGAVLLLGIAFSSEKFTRNRVEEAQKAENAARIYASGLERQRSAIIAMGMVVPAFHAWKKQKDTADTRALNNASENAAYSSSTRGLRMVLQIAALAIGAVLVLDQRTSPGTIVAGSILLGRALAPIDQSVGMWRQVVNARTAWRRLGQRLLGEKTPSNFIPLPRPDPFLEAKNLEIGVPGSERPIVPKFSISFEEGNLTALVGSVGSGKTTFLQTLAGAWPAMSGTIHLGGRDIHRWPSADRGQYIGYVPQDAELLSGTIAQNIARFGEADSNDVINAARSAGAHRTIMAMPDGYDTFVGPGGTHVSAGQKQLISLARAFFGSPALLLLDEPSANLDRHLHQVLFTALQGMRERGTIIVLATHDPRLIEQCDRVILMSPQRVAAARPEDYLAAPVAEPVSTSSQFAKRAE
ncbi:type I secretion system permease/ATPase [Altericroceibacterium spongiae]|uniref:Type I secretion system permease/ATPase n=1 Tax=Altericroceibacterium spongiae TaxID=2320269 RepID=A0A420EEH4_9SPHN|nr:type I secretion system permease/ATPase [Altericroceibacterium spongiae]RKF19083.1 type I secretion system permease/ATPase [Altericroceibacterium spongiae]